MATSSYELIRCQQTVEALREALNRLPNDQRLVFTPHVINGLSYRQIASMLDQPVDQIKRSYHIGREVLRQ